MLFSVIRFSFALYELNMFPQVIHPSKYFYSSYNGVTNFGPKLEVWFLMYKGSSNVHELLFLLIIVIHPFQI